MTTHPTRSAVEAMAKELRETTMSQSIIGCAGCCDNERDNAADMLLALLARAENAEAERDEARVQSKRAGEIGLAKWKEGIDRAATARAELAAARATIAMEINRRELAEEDLEAAHMVFDDYKAPRTDDGGTLSIAGRLRATIARLTREKAEAMEAEREACALIAAEASFGIDILVWVNSTKQGITAHVARAIARAIRARASKGTAI